MSGLLNEPKWGHLRDLHKAIKLCEPALVSVDPTVTWPGKNLEVRTILWCDLWRILKRLVENLFTVCFNFILGTCVQDFCYLCCIPCKLWHQIFLNNYIWKWKIWPPTLVCQHPSWLQNWSFQHCKSKTMLFVKLILFYRGV